MVLKKGGEAFLYRMPFNVERMLELGEKNNIVLRLPNVIMDHQWMPKPLREYLLWIRIFTNIFITKGKNMPLS